MEKYQRENIVFETKFAISEEASKIVGMERPEISVGQASGYLDPQEAKELDDMDAYVDLLEKTVLKLSHKIRQEDFNGVRWR